MKPSSAPGRTSHAKAKNAALLNLLAMPGLGSLLCRRWIAGGGQMLLSLAGFAVFLFWFVKQMVQFYGMITSDTPGQPITWIATTGVGLVGAAWLWSAVTSLSLIREASASSLQSLKNSAASPVQKLDEPQISLAQDTVPKWRRAGGAISRTFQFEDFPAAMKFVDAVAESAEAAWHHPDIDIRWNKVTLTLTTHDAGGLTRKDFELARAFDQLSGR